MSCDVSIGTPDRPSSGRKLRQRRRKPLSSGLLGMSVGTGSEVATAAASAAGPGSAVASADASWTRWASDLARVFHCWCSRTVTSGCGNTSRMGSCSTLCAMGRVLLCRRYQL